MKNRFTSNDDLISGLDAKIKDYNNDGLKDITYTAGTAARGANRVMQLLIYDKKGDSLIFVKNAREFPNLRYNEKLNCLDAFIVTGGNTSAFLKLESDSLRKIATVYCDEDGSVVTTYNKNGKEKIIYSDTVNAFGCGRFKNFSQVELNEEVE